MAVRSNHTVTMSSGRRLTAKNAAIADFPICSGFSPLAAETAAAYARISVVCGLAGSEVAVWLRA